MSAPAFQPLRILSRAEIERRQSTWGLAIAERVAHEDACIACSWKDRPGALCPEGRRLAEAEMQAYRRHKGAFS